MHQRLPENYTDLKSNQSYRQNKQVHALETTYLKTILLKKPYLEQFLVTLSQSPSRSATLKHNSCSRFTLVSPFNRAAPALRLTSDVLSSVWFLSIQEANLKRGEERKKDNDKICIKNGMKIAKTERILPSSLRLLGNIQKYRTKFLTIFKENVFFFNA